MQKSGKYQAVFKVKNRVKTWQVRGILSQQLEHIQVPKGGLNQVSGRVRVPCWHATPVANDPWKLLIIWWRSSSVSRSWNWWKVWLVGMPLLVKAQKAIKHWWEGDFILLNKIPVLTIKFPEWRFQATLRIKKIHMRSKSGLSYKLRYKKRHSPLNMEYYYSRTESLWCGK